jgi:homoserine kinase type II
MSEVTQLLSQYPTDCQSVQFEALGSAGGMSGAQFWRINSSRGMLCLRCWPVEHPSPQRLTFIHAVLQHAAGRGISFIPVPTTTREGKSFVHHAGHLWQLEPWMHGTADYEHAPCVEKLRAAMTAVAQFHLATSDFAPRGTQVAFGRKAESLPVIATPAIARRLAELHDMSKKGTSDLASAIDYHIWPELAPLARQFIALLPNAAQTAIEQLEPLAHVRLPLQACLRDIWHDHILFTGNDVTGIVDFGAIDIDTPATDIARLLGSLVGDDSEGWQTGLAAYSAVRQLSSEESAAVVALDKSGVVLAGCNWIRWIYVEGRDFENRQQVTDRFRMIVRRCAAAQRP